MICHPFVCLFFGTILISTLGATSATTQPSVTTRPASETPIRELVGEPDSIVQVANLVYAGTKSSRCFADHFLIQAEKESSISTSRRFHATKLSSDELF